jgi:hypothetical protein
MNLQISAETVSSNRPQLTQLERISRQLQSLRGKQQLSGSDGECLKYLLTRDRLKKSFDFKNIFAEKFGRNIGGFFWGGAVTPCASPPPRPSIFSIIFLGGSTTLLIRMAGISLHMQWPLTSRKYWRLKYWPGTDGRILKIFSPKYLAEILAFAK